MKKQENDPETKALSLSKDKLSKYCSCYMDRLADTVTFRDLHELKVASDTNSIPPRFQNLVNAANDACLTAFRRSLLGGR